MVLLGSPIQVFDLHSDIPADVIRRRAAGGRRVIAQRHIPMLRRGGVACACMAVWLEPSQRRDGLLGALRILDAMAREILDSPADIALCTTRAGVSEAIASGRLAVVLAVEGIGDIRRCEDFLYLLHHVGVRMASLTWNEENRLAGGVLSKRRIGLTRLGRRVVRQMQELRMLVDVSHLNERSFWGVLKESGGPVIASHSNARALCDVPRNLTDEQIRAVAATGGLIGVNAWPHFVDAVAPSVDRLIDHIAHIAGIAGVDHVGLGFDFSDYLGGDVVASIDPDGKVTSGLEDCTAVPGLIERMAARGFSPDDIRKVTIENALRLIPPL